MNAIRVPKRAGLRSGKTLTALFLLLMTLRPAKGAEILITVTGVIYKGYDQFHMFGVGKVQGGTDSLDLKGEPFTLVFTFDDAKGKPELPNLCKDSGTGITGRFATSPGKAVLTIGTGSFTFGTLKESISSAWRSILGPCSTSSITAEVHDGEGFDNGKSIINVSLFPAKPMTSLTQKPDWRSPLSVTENLNNSGGFFISKRGDFRHEAKADFDVKSVTVSAGGKGSATGQ
jgi:hypothetical protein